MAGWIKMPLGMEPFGHNRHGLKIGPGEIVLDGDPAPLPEKGGRAPIPNFRPMTIVAKRLDGSRGHSVRRWALV